MVSCNWGSGVLACLSRRWGQQGASRQGRQRGKRVVWLPNKSSGQIDPSCLWFQKSPCSCLWCVIGQWLGVGWEPWPLPVRLQQRMSANCSMSIFSSCLVCLAQSIFFSHGDQHNKEEITWEVSLVGFSLVGGQRAKSQGHLGTVGAEGALASQPIRWINWAREEQGQPMAGIQEGEVPGEGEAGERPQGLVGKHRTEKQILLCSFIPRTSCP